jgi:hypothetical protein
VKRVGAFNLSLLGKWCWRLLVDKEGLWYRVLKARYGEEGGRLKEGDRSSSAWWRSICRLREGVGEGIGNWFDNNIRRVVGDGKSTFFWHDIWVGDVPLKVKFPRIYDLSLYKDCSVEMMRRLIGSVDGRERLWRRRLLAWEEESVRECSVLLLDIVLQDNVDDIWRWLLDPIHGYSVRMAYRFLITSVETADRPQVPDIWHSHIPSKVSVFVWRLLRNRLPTKDNLLRRRVLSHNEVACVAGCGNRETAKHLFLDCDFFGSLWSHIWGWLGISSVSADDLNQHFFQFCHLAGLPRSTHMFFKIIWFTTVWVIWKERNDRVFNNQASVSSILMEKVKLTSFSWLKSKQAMLPYNYHDWWNQPLLCLGVHL